MTTLPAHLFRKKPVVIEAVQIEKRMDQTSPQWWAEAIQENRVILHGMGKWSSELPMVEIETLEGTMTGVQGDWIIRGVQGKLYPCKPDIFAATYEPADTPPATTQDAPITVSLDPDPRGVSVGVWQGSHCIYNGAHAVPAPAAGDARDAERWRSFRNAITQQDLGWLDRMDTALTALGCDLDDETPPSADQVDAAADAAIAAQQGKGGEA